MRREDIEAVDAALLAEAGVEMLSDDQCRYNLARAVINERRLQQEIERLKSERKQLRAIIVQGAASVLRLRSFDENDPMDKKLRLIAVRMKDDLPASGEG